MAFSFTTTHLLMPIFPTDVCLGHPLTNTVVFFLIFAHFGVWGIFYITLEINRDISLDNTQHPTQHIVSIGKN